MKFRYKSVDVSNLGPFGPNNILYLEDKICFIMGDWASGKTTLARALLGIPPDPPPNLSGLGVNRQGPTKGKLDLEGSQESAESFLVGWLEDGRALTKVQQCDILCESLSKGLIKSEQISDFEKLVSAGINKILFKKMISHGIEEFSFHVDASNKCGSEIRSNGENYSGYFYANTERMVLHLAILSAIRRLAQALIEAPFVIDQSLGDLDPIVLNEFVSFIRTLSSQIICMGSPSFFLNTGIKPNFTLIRDIGGTADIVEGHKC